MKAGFVALLGRPNAGKSTLLNRLVGHKLAIVSDKPQTTRTRILGVRHYEAGQVVFVDTPGVHKPAHRMNVRMVDAAREAVRDVDVIVLVVDASAPAGAGDRYVLSMLEGVRAPVVLALNKVDIVQKTALLPLIDAYRRLRDFAGIVPISAVDGTNVEAVEGLVLDLLPEGEPLYPPDFVTDQPERVMVSEIVREQVLRHTRDELPFLTAVAIERFEEAAGRRPARIYCTIYVERPSQKGIVVGKGGSMIRDIGTSARQELERYLEVPVFLDLHVKVRPAWRDDARALHDVGLDDA
ncbi:MAG: GTPase Era [Acidobacteria bacterium]|nr:GTPase Era [Acidobacteriota bacterium]